MREIEVKLNRKKYSIPAVICDVSQEILGMDFIKKFKLNFEWDEFDQSELYLVDRKADIKQLLQVVTVPVDTPRISYLDPGEGRPHPRLEQIRSGSSSEEVAFQVACMQKLDQAETRPPKKKDCGGAVAIT